MGEKGQILGKRNSRKNWELKSEQKFDISLSIKGREKSMTNYPEKARNKYSVIS